MQFCLIPALRRSAVFFAEKFSFGKLFGTFGKPQLASLAYGEKRKASASVSPAEASFFHVSLEFIFKLFYLKFLLPGCRAGGFHIP